MKLSDKLTSTLEKIIWIYLFANPFIDIITGIYIREVLHATELDIINASFSSTPGLIIRMAMLLIFGVYILMKKDKFAIGTLVGMGLAFVVSIAVLILRGAQLSLGVDIKYFIKFCYNIVMLFAYIQVFRSMYDDKQELLNKLRTLITYTCIVYALGIIIPYVLGLGYSTYADRLGYRGCRGYFYSGNDVTAVLAILFPLAIANNINYEKKSNDFKRILILISPALMLIALLLIGSKTAFLAAGASVFALLCYCAFSKKDVRGIRTWRMLCFLLVAVLLFLLLTLAVGGDKALEDINTSVSAPKKFATNENVSVAVLSGRSDTLGEQLGFYKNGGVLSWIFGIGRSSVDGIIEMDLFEVVIYYGLFGALMMLWVYVKLGIDFVKNLFKNFSLMSFAMFMGIGLTIGYLLIAGHVLFTVTSGQYLVLVIIISRVFFSENKDEISLKLKA